MPEGIGLLDLLELKLESLAREIETSARCIMLLEAIQVTFALHPTTSKGHPDSTT